MDFQNSNEENINNTNTNTNTINNSNLPQDNDSSRSIVVENDTEKGVVGNNLEKVIVGESNAVQNNGVENNPWVKKLFHSKFFWLTVLFIAIICLVIFIAESKIAAAREEAREATLNIYPGLPAEGGFPTTVIYPEYFYRDEYNFLAYEDDTYYTRRGIDVSEHQGEIDWEAVRESGVEFAMIRLGYSASYSGNMYLDKYFEANYEGAKAAGIEVGVYYFSQAINVEEAIEEAKLVCENIKDKDITMPVAYDMEPVSWTTDDRIHVLGMPEITEITDAFCTIIENHGYETVVYGNPSWIFNNVNLSLLPERNIWMAHYTENPSFPYKYVMWQYSSTGIIGGIDTLVDLDLLFVKK